MAGLSTAGFFSPLPDLTSVTASRRTISASLLALALVCGAAPAHADPISLASEWPSWVMKPGDVLRVTFDLRWLAPQPPGTSDVLLFMPGLTPIEPIGSYTTTLLDRGRLLGTYNGTGAAAEEVGFGSWFIPAGSVYTRGNPTVIDFTTLYDRTFDGVLEFEIHSGLAHVYRASDEIDLSGSGFAPRTFEIIPAAPVPEPASLLLLAAGAAVAIRRRRASGVRNTRTCPVLPR